MPPYLSTLADWIPFGYFVEMFMALDAGKIDRMELQQSVAKYFFRLKGNNEKYIPYMICRGVTYYASMGFREGSNVKIAVTGDMPPIDYIAADGTPTGFNTAMLAEIARRLKVNIELSEYQRRCKIFSLGFRQS